MEKKTDKKKIKIIEVFYSIQGEGLFQGLPTIFLRLAGCNLRCSYCDTKYSYSGGIDKTVDEVVKLIKRYPSKRLCITGGEPLLQDGCLDLVKKLKDFDISIETNGSINTSKYNKIAKISLDIKCPASLMHNKMLFSNLNSLSKKDQVKFIVNHKKDLDYAYKIIREYRLIYKTNVIINPVFNSDYKKIAQYILDKDLDIRFGLQIHKFIWKPSKRGV